MVSVGFNLLIINIDMLLYLYKLMLLKSKGSWYEIARFKPKRINI